MSGGYMQGYIPRLFGQSITMQKFLLSIFQHNLGTKIDKFNYAFYVVLFIMISHDLIE